MNAKKIIAIATGYIGILEKPGNTGFYNAPFEVKMRKVGFYTGAPWCAFFTKLVLVESYMSDTAYAAVLNSTLTGGAVDSYNKCKRNGIPTGTVPRPGAIVVWKNGNGPAGHIGVVVSVDGNTMTTIEGNTNASGSREGDRVAKKLRTVNRDFQKSGLNIVGYIYPKGV
ncbi:MULTISPECIES: CHAP domain-containing protein [unclassified Sphingobacterium]|uniref:CHAP domain-containing protein n=1 Tax=unclassified Sphingobacterium TaxID=2609468 RepID=UPI0025E20C68|nr:MULTISPECIES: CHAP domain-containing protein [unclassified Sphingobacterium]